MFVVVERPHAEQAANFRPDICQTPPTSTIQSTLNPAKQNDTKLISMTIAGASQLKNNSMDKAHKKYTKDKIQTWKQNENIRWKPTGLFSYVAGGQAYSLDS